jgi:hypothetical protein
MKKNKNILLLLGLLAITLGLASSCKRGETAAHGPVMKISVYSDGRLLVDGASATLDSLKPSLQQLASKQGVVWYYREASAANPPQIAMDVMQAIGEAKLPVRLSTEADFKDVTKAEAE